eukprot:GILJ01036006.1.p1 GENE.GILJ01036006.1~~GILJ01036006.1.p1  ORF type:complete len:273 (-),score=20.28 GILJ01036006.1:48-815(-)
MQTVYLPLKRLPNVSLHYTVYLGANIQSDIQIETLVNSSFVTMLYVAVYVVSPNSAFGSLNDAARTIRRIETAAGKLEGYSQRFGVILSAEGNAYAAGTEHFMGDWLAAHNDGSTILESTEGNVSAVVTPPFSSQMTFDGFQWYEYIFTGLYLSSTSLTSTSTSTSTSATVTNLTTNLNTNLTTTSTMPSNTTSASTLTSTTTFNSTTTITSPQPTSLTTVVLPTKVHLSHSHGYSPTSAILSVLVSLLSMLAGF